MYLLCSLAGACVLCSFATALFRVRNMEKLRLATKLMASVLFCVTGLAAAALRERMSAAAALLLGALLLGLVGDIMLGLDRFAADDPSRQFLYILGGVTFFFGHLLFIALLLPIGSFEPGVLLILPVVPVLFLMLQKAKVVDFGRDLLPLMLYGSFLSAMMMSTVNVARQGANIPQGEALSRLMILPGVLFAASDSLLFIRRYGTERTKKLMSLFEFGVMLTYYAAQALFALAVRVI